MRRRVVTALVTVALGVAGLSSVAGAGEDGGLPEENVPSDQPGVTDTEIRVGGVASETNPLGGDYASAFDGVKAFFEMVNSEGGIYGRELNLVAERDDQVGNNRSEVQALLTQEDLFAVMPVSTLVFAGADLLEESGVPTFGWNINAEWGSEDEAGSPNMFGEKGSFLCFTCSGALLPWLTRELDAEKVGLLAYNVPQSSACAEGVQASFDDYPSADVEFVDTSLAFGVTDLSAQVAQMREDGVDFVTTCMDNNGALTLAREMRLQGLDAVQYLPNAYNHEFIDENAEFFEGSYALTFFTPFETRPRPQGLKLFNKWMKEIGAERNENSLAGWINADLLVTGLELAGPEFTQADVVEQINALTDYDAKGLLGGVDWTVQHADRPDPICNALSEIEDGKFKPAFGERGEPFICFEKDAPRLPREPAVKG